MLFHLQRAMIIDCPHSDPHWMYVFEGGGIEVILNTARKTLELHDEDNEGFNSYSSMENITHSFISQDIPTIYFQSYEIRYIGGYTKWSFLRKILRWNMLRIIFSIWKIYEHAIHFSGFLWGQRYEKYRINFVTRKEIFDIEVICLSIGKLFPFQIILISRVTNFSRQNPYAVNLNSHCTFS